MEDKNFLWGQIPFIENIGYKEPELKVEDINENGEYFTQQADKVNVDVPNPSSGTISITENGEVDVTSYATANVAVPQPSGKITITANGTDININDYATADVNVPNPSSGTLQITENNLYDVTTYAAVNVNVSGGGSANNVFGIIESTYIDSNYTSSDFMEVALEEGGSADNVVILDQSGSDTYLHFKGRLVRLDCSNTTDTSQWSFIQESSVSGEWPSSIRLSCVVSNADTSKIDVSYESAEDFELYCTNAEGVTDTDVRDYLNNLSDISVVDINGQYLTDLGANDVNIVIRADS